MPLASGQHYYVFFFFLNDTATTEIYTLPLHDALPICSRISPARASSRSMRPPAATPTLFTSTSRPPTSSRTRSSAARSEEHTSELQSRQYLVCRLLLEKKKNKNTIEHNDIRYSSTLST